MANAGLALNAARGQCLLIVVLFHAYIVLQPQGMVHGGYQYVVDALTYVPMPLLFFISGAKFQSVAARTGGRPLLNRVAAYLYLYVTWTAIYIAFGLAFGGKSVTVASLDVQDLAALFVFPATVLWFLYSLALYFLLARLIRGLDVRVQVALGALLAVAAHFQVFTVEGTLVHKVAGHFLYFLIGANFGSRLQGALFGARWTAALPLMLAYPALVLCVKVAGISASPVAVELMGVLGLSALLAFAPVSLRLPFGRLFQEIGRNALPIYLLHSLFLDLALGLHGATALPGNDTVSRLLNPFLLGAAAILGSLAAYRTLRSLPGLFHAPPGVLRVMSASIGKTLTPSGQHTA